jgi:DNA-binding MarR family transcriptional regulator
MYKEGMFNLESSIGYLISKTRAKFFSCLLKTLQPYDVTPEQWGLLNRLWAQDGLNQKDIAQLMIKDQTNLTRMIDKLEDKGYLLRMKDPNDRRAFLIHLTEEGKKLEHVLIPLVIELEEKLTENISQSKIEIIKKILQQMSEEVDELD